MPELQPLVFDPDQTKLSILDFINISTIRVFKSFVSIDKKKQNDLLLDYEYF